MRCSRLPFASLLLLSCASTRAVTPPPVDRTPVVEPAAATTRDVAPRPRVVPVVRRTLSLAIDGTATLAPGTEGSVVARMNGVVLRLMADTNAQVHRGQVLALVGPPGGGVGRREELRATIDGVVFERRVNLGDPVEGSRTVLFALGTLDPLRGRAEVEERHALALHVGQPLALRVDAMPDRVFASVIQQVEVTLTAAHTLAFGFQVPNPDLMLRPGMSASVRIALGTHEDAMTVPAEAIVRDGGEPRVFVVAERQARLRRISLGISQDGVIEVLDGLEPSNRVLSPAVGVHEGDAVEASE